MGHNSSSGDLLIKKADRQLYIPNCSEQINQCWLADGNSRTQKSQTQL